MFITNLINVICNFQFVTMLWSGITEVDHITTIG